MSKFRNGSPLDGSEDDPALPNGRKHRLNSELIRRDKNKRRRADSLKRSTALTTNVMTALGVGSSCGFVALMLGADGFSFLDAAVTGSIGAGVYLGVSLLWRYGAEELPEKPRDQREGMVPAFLAGMGVWCAVSVSSSAAWLAYPPAAVADLTRNTEYTLESSGEIESAHRELYALAPALKTQAAALVEATKLEGESGGFCEQGRGKGRCFTQLKTLTVQTDRTAKDLEDAARANQPIMSRMAESREKIRRVMEHEDLSFKDKSDQITELSESLTTDTRTLVASLSVQSVRGLHEVYAADFDAAGLSRVGTSRLRNMLAASRTNLRKAVEDATRASEMVIKPKASTSPFAVLFRNLDSVWNMALLSALPEFVTAFLVSFAFMTTRREDDDYGEDDPEHASVPLEGPSSTGGANLPLSDLDEAVQERLLKLLSGGDERITPLHKNRN